ncbi:hypothetical protein CLAIMM_01246 [Cladophialophora immunda]|nr:hypothetical protein CLAIMM_01246 [Cladophialophora immunda]
MVDFSFETARPSQWILAAAINVTFDVKADPKSLTRENTQVKKGAIFHDGEEAHLPVPPTVIAVAPEGYVPLERKPIMEPLDASVGANVAVRGVGLTAE